MGVTRREFLLAPAAVAAAALAVPVLLSSCAGDGPPLPDLSGWDKVRAMFPLDPAYAHFASFFVVSHPKPVQDAIDEYRRAIDANPFQVVSSGDPGDGPPRVREAIAAYLGGEADDIALTPNTTTGLALVYQGLPLAPGDEVLCTTHDHFVHHESIRLATRRTGATMRKIALFADPAQASIDSIVGALRAGIGPRTRVVGLTWVHSSTGMRLPIREMARALRDVPEPPLLVVDGVHGLGAVDETVAGMGCDYFCAGTHKWMFAPRGTGLVWASADNWARLSPSIPSFSDSDARMAWEDGLPEPETLNNARRMSPGGFVDFEHQWATAVAFRMHQAMGRARVAARIRELNDQCKAGLAAIPGVRLHTPMSADLSAGLVCFEVDGRTPDQVVEGLLARRIIASTSPYRTSYARLAPSLVNSPEQVEAAVGAVRAIAG